MNTGLADIGTNQTFNLEAYLFPTTLMTPAMTISIATIDDVTGNPGSARPAHRGQHGHAVRAPVADGDDARRADRADVQRERRDRQRSVRYLTRLPTSVVARRDVQRIS
jgi:hypothetical protein